METNISEILNHLSQGDVDNYDTWLSVGMALHKDGQPISVWEEWSKQSSKYKDGCCYSHWKSFDANKSNAIGIGTIVEMAKRNGYVASGKMDFDSVFTDRKAPMYCKSNLAPIDEFKAYLNAVFKKGDNVNYVVATYQNNDGKWIPSNNGTTISFDELISDCERFKKLEEVIGDWNENAGGFIRINPTNATGTKNSDITDYRHCLIESDKLSKEEQLAKIKEFKLPCSAIVDSGGKSIHAIVRIDAGTDEKLYRNRVLALHNFLEKNGFPVDKACKNPNRLSRLAGVSRNGNRQHLIGTNIGTTSFEEWETKRDFLSIDSVSIDDFWKADADDMSDCILGYRFLCTEAPWLIVAASGVGKSVLAMQMSILFSIGRDLWKLSPHKPRKVVLIQAENNFLDLVEPAQSITKVLDLSEDERNVLRKNFRVVSNDTHSGEGFVKLLENICEKFSPDIVIVDPLMAYIGGDISKQEVCTKFFRNGINPVIHKHKIALIVLHHTGKPRSKEFKTSGHNSDLEYLGIGSSDITNWARAVSIIVPSADNKNVFEFKHVKRGRRTGTDGVVYLKQGKDHKDIFWYDTDKPAKIVKTQKGDGKKSPNSNPLYDKLQLETLPPMSKTDLLKHIKNKLSKLGEPCADSDVQKVFENCRKSYMVFGETTRLWTGKLYIPECPENKASEGGTL